jgi:hypothetical protein
MRKQVKKLIGDMNDHNFQALDARSPETIAKRRLWVGPL